MLKKKRIVFVALMMCGFVLASSWMARPVVKGSTQNNRALFYTEWSPPKPVTELNIPLSDYPNGISRDGLSLYFHRVNPGTSEDLYVVHRPDSNANWGVPVKLPDGVNSNANERTAFVSSDDHWLFFASDRPGGKGGSDLYASWRANIQNDGDWQPPVNLSVVNSPGFDSGPALFEDEESGTTQLFFASTPFPGGVQAQADIYLSTLGANGFGPPSPVVELNSPAQDARPYLRRDGREIFIQSNRAGALSIFVSRRLSATQPWSPPELAIGPADLGDPSVTLLVTPVLSWDAATLFIGVWRNGIDTGDIYVSHREMVSAANICFHSPQYYLLNLQQVSNKVGNASVVVSGVNYNQPIHVADNLGMVRSALQGNSFPGLAPSTPEERLNQEFLAAQLSVALAGSPGSPAAYGVLNGQLQCYDSMISFRPIHLSSGTKLTRYSTIGELFEQARLALYENRVQDMDALSGLFDLLNGNDPSGNCHQ